jgi:hypothetical protein
LEEVVIDDELIEKLETMLVAMQLTHPHFNTQELLPCIELARRGAAVKWRPIEEAPKEPGFYWAKWHTKDPGTADMMDAPSNLLEVVEVFQNSIEESDEEYLRVFVGGVERGQSLKNFTWVAKVPSLSALGEPET